MILIALIGFGAWSFYTKNMDSAATGMTRTSDSADLRSEAPGQSSRHRFTCDGRQEQMTEQERKRRAQYCLV
jgi:hypothetical protein